MRGVVLSQQKLFGLLELDAAGTVLYSVLEGASNFDDSAADVAGHNFYTEVAPFMNVEEFHQRLDDFDRSSERANKFVFVCFYEDSPVPVSVLLAHTYVRTNGDHTKSLLVHIKKVG